MTPALVEASTLVIRTATEADLPRIVEMGQHFIASTPYRDQVNADVEALGESLRLLFTIGTVFVAERDGDDLVGMLGATVYSHYLTHRRTATESFWWGEPEARGTRAWVNLLAAFEAWAHDQGARVIELGSWNPRLDRVYERRLGYVAGERIYRKEIP